MLNWLPENVSTYGGDVDALFYVIYYLTTIVWLAVTAALVVFIIKYRRREGRKAEYSHGNTTLEIVWTSATFIIMIALALVSQPTWAKIKERAPAGDVTVEVTGKQFNWIIRYPGPDEQFGTADDLQVENELHVPVDKNIRLILKSSDVIHSFFVPQFRLKQDSLPGREIPAWFKATKTGKYEIACAELCGFGHGTMRGWVYVLTDEEYAQWVKEHWPSS